MHPDFFLKPPKGTLFWDIFFSFFQQDLWKLLLGYPIFATEDHPVNPKLSTIHQLSQMLLHSTHRIQLMEKGIWHSLVGKSDYL